MPVVLAHKKSVAKGGKVPERLNDHIQEAVIFLGCIVQAFERRVVSVDILGLHALSVHFVCLSE